MRVVFHEKFYEVYAGDPAAAAGRMEAIIDVISPVAELIEPVSAREDDIAAVHTRGHIQVLGQNVLAVLDGLAP